MLFIRLGSPSLSEPTGSRSRSAHRTSAAPRL